MLQEKTLGQKKAMFMSVLLKIRGIGVAIAGEYN